MAAGGLGFFAWGGFPAGRALRAGGLWRFRLSFVSED